jgi:hypothetical protein
MGTNLTPDTQYTAYWAPQTPIIAKVESYGLGVLMSIWFKIHEMASLFHTENTVSKMVKSELVVGKDFAKR